MVIVIADIQENLILSQPIKTQGCHFEIQIVPKGNDTSAWQLENICNKYGDWICCSSGEEY